MCLWCYFEFDISTTGELKNLPDHGGDRTATVGLLVYKNGKIYKN